jgi:hypothetical protein
MAPGFVIINPANILLLKFALDFCHQMLNQENIQVI